MLGKLKDLKDVVHLAFENSKTVACVSCTVDTQPAHDMLNMNMKTDIDIMHLISFNAIRHPESC